MLHSSELIIHTFDATEGFAFFRAPFPKCWHIISNGLLISESLMSPSKNPSFGNAAIFCCCRGEAWISKQTGIFQIFWKKYQIFWHCIFFSVQNAAIYLPNILAWIFFFGTKCCCSWENKKYETICPALEQIILLIYPICLFIQFFYFL